MTLDILEESDCLSDGQFLSSPPPGEEIVISGISGNFPASKDLSEFYDNLINKRDLFSDNLHTVNRNPDSPRRTARLKDINKFDASFFGMANVEANASDVVLRKFYEHVFEALLDAGVHPSTLKGTNTIVVLAETYSESEIQSLAEISDLPYSLKRCFKATHPGIISHALGLKGPAYVVDTACSTSSYAVHVAYQSLRQGICDAAIIAGGNLCLKVATNLAFAKLGVLSTDCIVRSFDENANGYVRAEATSCIFLQKLKDAKRNYGTIVHCGTNCDGYKPEGITFPSSKMQEICCRQVYVESGIDPNSIKYVEAHGTGTKAGDPEELFAVHGVFASKKTPEDPLLIGSVKSNMGHSEPMSGICSIAKVILAMETGLIAPNINYNSPRKGVVALEKGLMKVVTEPTPFPGGPVGINSFGFGGSNSHLLLAPNPKEKVNKGIPSDKLPRLVILSGRTYDAVETFLEKVCQDPIDAELVYLTHEIFSQIIPGHLFRGYAISSSKDRRIQDCRMENFQPILLILSSGGSFTFSKYFESLKEIPPFCSTIDRCIHFLGKDLMNMLMSSITYQNPTFKYLAIAILQIGLINVLRVVGISPSLVIGNYPVKEFAEGHLTEDETLHILHQIYLKEIDGGIMSDHNGQLKRFMKSIHETLRHEESLNGLGLLNSAQVGDDQNSKLCRYTVLELSSNQTISGSLNLMATCENLLESFGKLFLLGFELKLSNLYPCVQTPVSRGTALISPLLKWDHKEDYIVYSEYILDFNKEDPQKWEELVVIKVMQDQHTYLTGHVIDGRNLFPATGYLMLVTNIIEIFESYEDIEGALIFEDVRFMRATIIPRSGSLAFIVTIHRSQGKFEVVQDGVVVATGRVRSVKESTDTVGSADLPIPAEGKFLETKDIYKELRLRGYNYSGLFRGLTKIDVSGKVGSICWNDNWVTYMDNMLQMSILNKDTRNLYVPTIIKKVTIDFKKHMSFVSKMGESKDIPVYLWKNTSIISSGGIEICGLNAAPIARRKNTAIPVLEKYRFISHSDVHTDNMNLSDLLRICVHLAMENNPLVNKLTIAEICNSDCVLAPEISNILADLPVIQATITVLGDPADIRFEKLGKSIEIVKRNIRLEKDCHIVVASNILKGEDTLTNALNALTGNGYLLLVEDEASTDQLDLAKVEIIFNRNANGYKVQLLKKRTQIELEPVIIKIEGKNYEWIQLLQKALSDNSDRRNILLVSQRERLSGLLGMFNCIRREITATFARCFIILDHDAPDFDPKLEFYHLQLRKDLAVNIYYNKQWGSYRHLPLEINSKQKYQHVYNNVLNRGDLSSVTWLQGNLCPRLKKSEDIVHVYYASLNFRDVMMATGRVSVEGVTENRIEQECVTGFEYSGKDSNGCRVMGLVTGGSMSNMVTCVRPLIWKVPNNWSLEEAATVPVVYCTVIFALDIVGKFKQGASVLIHAGSGGIGQAALHYCLYHNCTVFTTVSTQQKRDFILKTFPQVSESHIGNSRDTSFEQMIFEQTEGRGVDFVINSLSDDKLFASLRCLAPGGKFLEIGKFDIISDTIIDTGLFAPRISVHGVMLDKIFENKTGIMEQLVSKLYKGIQEGSICPLVRTIFSVTEMEQAYRFLGTGKHIGKVIVNIRPEEQDMHAKPSPLLMEALPRFYCKQELSYIILGGLGGFGLELSDWLVLRGARKIVLTSRRGISNGYQSYKLNNWKTYGVKIVVAVENASTREGVIQLLDLAATLGPVGGIFNLAVDLKDAAFVNQTEDAFVASAQPKAVSTILLDEESRLRCPSLHQFVVFSSVSCGRGNAGQSNYGMSNSVMERVCERRSMDGLPGVAIQWGAVGDVGLVADMQDEDKEIVIGGTLPQKIVSCLSLLDCFLLQSHPVVASMVVAEKRNYGDSGSIVQTVANILGINDLKTINHNATLAELGMDSVMAVEIKQVIESSVDIFLTANDMRNLTLASLAKLEDEGIIEPDSVPPNDSSTANDILHDLIEKINDENELRLHNIFQITNGQIGASTIYFITGIDGGSKAIINMAAKVTAKSVCLQTGLDIDRHTDIYHLAEYFLPSIVKDLSANKTFNIIAHSYGGLVAMEIIKSLEKYGYLGQLFLIDCSPEYLKSLAISTKGNIMDTIIIRFLSFLNKSQNEIADVQKKLQNLTLWEEKLNIVFNNSTIDKTIGAIAITLLNTLHYRFNDVMNYYIKGTIKSKVYLFKASSSNFVECGDSWGLDKICEQPVEIHVVEGTHISMMENGELIEIIGSKLNCLRNNDTKDSTVVVNVPKTELRNI